MRFVVISALILAGCSSMSEGTMMSGQASSEATAGMNLCLEKANLAKNGSYVSLSVCDNAALIGAYQRSGYPYMDLIQMVANESTAEAYGLDARQMTLDQAHARLANVFAQASQIEAQRNAANSERRAVAAMMFYNAMQNVQRSYTPQPVPAYQSPPARRDLNCTTSYVGTQAYTHCQ